MSRHDCGMQDCPQSGLCALKRHVQLKAHHAAERCDSILHVEIPVIDVRTARGQDPYLRSSMLLM